MKYPHKATVWIPGERDDFGAPTWVERIPLDVRWEQRSRLFINQEGREVRSAATVYVQQFVPIGSYIARGQHSSSVPVSAAWEVKDYREIDNLRATRTERRLML